MSKQPEKTNRAARQFSLEELLEALLSAEAHVGRQQGHGRHDQDRVDATAWVEKYGPMMRTIRKWEEPK